MSASFKKYKRILKNDHSSYYKKQSANLSKKYESKFKNESNDTESNDYKNDIRINSDWVDPNDVYDSCYISNEEYHQALKQAKKKLIHGKKPQNPDVKPKFYVTIGAPGSGKSTLIQHIAHKLNPELDFVSIDLDLAIEFHPRYKSMWSADSAVNNSKTNIGFTLTRQICNDNLEGMMESIFYEIMKDNTRHNVIIQTQDLDSIILARSLDYEINMVFVGVSLDKAIKRSKIRAIKTGKFLAPNIHVQNRIVEEMWNDYKYNTAWYGLWVDNVYIIDNNVDVDIEKEEIMKVIKIKRFNYYDFTHTRDGRDNREEYIKLIQAEVDKVVESPDS